MFWLRVFSVQVLSCILFSLLFGFIGQQLASLIAKKQRPILPAFVGGDIAAVPPDEVSDVDVQSDGSAVLNTDDEMSNSEDEDEEVDQDVEDECE